MSHMLLAESSEKTRTIERCARQADKTAGWSSFPTYGHIVKFHPDKPALNTTIHRCNWVYANKRHLNKLLKKAIDTQDVWIATDDTPEGEFIAHQLVQEIRRSFPTMPCRRLRLNELSPDSIVEAAEHLDDINRTMVVAYEAKRYVDRYIYDKCRFILSDIYPQGIERVEAELLYRISSADPTSTVFELDVDLLDRRFTAEYGTAEEAESAIVAWNQQFVKSDQKSRIAVVEAPRPMNFRDLVAASSRYLNLSSVEVFTQTRRLYDLGLITNPATDDRGMREQAYREAVSKVEAVDASILGPKPSWVGSPEGIRVVFPALSPSEVSPSLRPLYRLLWASTLSSVCRESTRRLWSISWPTGQEISGWFREDPAGWDKLFAISARMDDAPMPDLSLGSHRITERKIPGGLPESAVWDIPNGWDYYGAIAAIDGIVQSGLADRDGWSLSTTTFGESVLAALYDEIPSILEGDFYRWFLQHLDTHLCGGAEISLPEIIRALEHNGLFL